MKLKNNLVRFIVPLFIILVVFACGEDESIEQKDSIFDIQGKNGFVGTVDDTDAFIALLVSKKEALVYVCNGEEEIYEWFRGNVIDPENFSLTNGYSAKVDVKFDGSLMKGNVVLSDKTTHSFTATPNTGNDSGIFQVFGDLASQEGIAAGWILNTKGEERGSFRLNSVFQPTPQKPKANSIAFKNNSFSIQRFSVSWHPDSLAVIQTNR